MSSKALPPDIDPVSRCRLPLPKRDELDEAGKKVYDHHITPGGQSLAGLNGPGGIRLHSPKLSVLQSPPSKYLRWEAGLSGQIRELIIIVTAREMGSEFEWFQHEGEAIKEGVSRTIVDAVKYRKPLDGIPETEATIIAFGRELIGQHKVSSETFARALKLFGKRTLVDIVSLMGNYTSTALLLAAFDAHLPEGHEPSLPK